MGTIITNAEGKTIGEQVALIDCTFEVKDGCLFGVLGPYDGNPACVGNGMMGGWDEMRQRMIGNGSRPMIYCFSTCKDSIRTIPALPHDQTRPEDVDTNSEDHAPDDWRYACMSRPWVNERATSANRGNPGYGVPKDERGTSWRT